VFFKRVTPQSERFIAVTEFENQRTLSAALLYGKRAYRLTLADGTVETIYLESEVWSRMEQPLIANGFVVNA